MAAPCGRLDLAHVLAEMPAVLDFGVVCAEDFLGWPGWAHSYYGTITATKKITLPRTVHTREKREDTRA